MDRSSEYYNRGFVGNRLSIHIRFDRDNEGNVFMKDGYYHFSIEVTDKSIRSLILIYGFKLDKDFNVITPENDGIYLNEDFMCMVQRQASVMAEMNLPARMEQ